MILWWPSWMLLTVGAALMFLWGFFGPGEYPSLVGSIILFTTLWLVALRTGALPADYRFKEIRWGRVLFVLIGGNAVLLLAETLGHLATQ